MYLFVQLIYLPVQLNLAIDWSRTVTLKSFPGVQEKEGA
jgi:hypothetical protein